MKIVVTAKSWPDTEAIIRRLLELPHRESGVLYPLNTPLKSWQYSYNVTKSRWLRFDICDGKIIDAFYTRQPYARRLTHSVAQVHRLLRDPAFLKRHKLIP
jgi:hypothetical protein